MALGRISGVAQMEISQAHVISSMSLGWLASVRQSGRFGVHTWDRTESVKVTTLDALITEHGLPAFCKLDVEGFESEVLAGLSSPIPALSFECTPEYMINSTSCIDRLSELGEYEFNYNLSETMNMELDHWVAGGQMKRLLEALPKGVFGDVYARRLHR